MRRLYPFAPALLLVAVALSGAGPCLAAAASTSTVAKSAKPARAEVLPWIVDDYERALATAKTRKVPLFIESWAPW